MPIIAISLLIAAALGGGVSVAAQGAVPGEALWGFKTTVNEGLRGTLAFSQEQKAGWDIAVAEARLKEAQTLAARGSLSAEAQTTLDSAFRARVESVKSRITRLAQQGDFEAAADIAARFETSIAKHASTLADASARASTNAQGALAPLLGSVRATLETASNISAQAKADAEANVGARTDADAQGRGNSTSSANANVNAHIDVDADASVNVGI